MVRGFLGERLSPGFSLSSTSQELESKKKASAEKKANVKKQREVEEAKMRFRLRCLDVLQALFIHINDADAFLSLFDTLVDLETATRLKAGSALAAKATFDNKVRHLVKEVAQFRRNAPLHLSVDQTAAALTRLKKLLADNLLHASPQSEISSLTHIIVKILIAENDSESLTSNQRKCDVNAAYLDYLLTIVGEGKDSKDGTDATSSAVNVRYEHFAPFESLVNRFQSEVVDEDALLRLEALLYHQEMAPFCRKQIAGIVSKVIGILCRRGGEEDKGMKILKRNLDACTDGVNRDMEKKDVSGNF